MKRKTVLLIDGDEYLYKATTAVEKEIHWDEDFHVLFSDFAEAWSKFTRDLEDLKKDLGADELRLAFTKGHSFRKGLYEDYKGNRVATRKPMCFSDIRDKAEATYKSLSHPGLEADDILGIWATRDEPMLHKIIVSQDKDLQTIPGYLYRKGEVLTITQEQANYHWMYQTLVGDRTDGFPGCPGVGEKTAEQWLRGVEAPTEENMWRAVVDQYERKGLTEEVALTQARLARILRASDWNAETKEVILWTPA